MYVIGIDVSKGHSTICMISSDGEIIQESHELKHTKAELNKLYELVQKYSNTRVVLEATGRYHLPVLSYLMHRDVFVSCINPLTMKKFSDLSIRRGKTDKKDSMKIAQYGLVNWSQLKPYVYEDNIYLELRSLSRQYYGYMELKIRAKQTADGFIDKILPNINKILQGEKLYDFVDEYWHNDNITRKTLQQFCRMYNSWAKKKGYQPSRRKAEAIYNLATNNIPTLDSNYVSTKLLVRESIQTITRLESSCTLILTQMEELANRLPEYQLLVNMKGIGIKLAVRLIAEIGDIKKIKSKNALIALAGIDTPPFESGQFVGKNRHISKRGNKYIRKTGYEIMQSYKMHKPNDNVYEYMIRKELEGMPKKKAKIAALNKFLKQYYAKVTELYL